MIVTDCPGVAAVEEEDGAWVAPPLEELVDEPPLDELLVELPLEEPLLAEPPLEELVDAPPLEEPLDAPLLDELDPAGPTTKLVAALFHEKR